MIATILPSSSNYHAIAYNEHKREKGSAELIEVHNIPPFLLENISAGKLQNFFIDYSAKNDRIDKSQFHVAISCKGQEWTKEQLLDFAHKWLHEMGYDNDGQPWLIYAHTDTDNNHIHIITSRVDPLGRKIDHNHERRRSQKIIDKILGIETAEKNKKDLENAFTYKFDSPMQFRAIMESMGYKAFSKDEKMYFTKGGGIRLSVTLKEIQDSINSEKPTKQELSVLRGIFSKYQPLSGNRTELQDYLKSNFGISLVFFGPKDKPYGYSVVDHANKKVYRGQRVMPIEQLLDFAPFEERIDRIDTFIHDSLMANPNLGLKDMRRMLLKKFGATIRQGDIVIGDKSMPVNPSYLDTLKLNDRIAWAKGFNVTTDAERKLLSRLTKVPAPLLPLGPVDANKDIQINALKDILEKQGYQGLVDFLRNNGFSVHKQDDTRVAVNFKTGEIIDLGQCGLKVEKKQKSSRQNKSNASNGLHVGPARLDRGHKRDWEIESGQDEDKKLGV